MTDKIPEKNENLFRNHLIGEWDITADVRAFFDALYAKTGDKSEALDRTARKFKISAHKVWDLVSAQPPADGER